MHYTVLCNCDTYFVFLLYINALISTFSSSVLSEQCILMRTNKKIKSLCCFFSRFVLVINELDGLSKGGRDRQSEFSDMLRSGARLALNYLEQEFEARNSHLKSMTSEGTILDTIAFRSEQFKDMVCSYSHFSFGWILGAVFWIWFENTNDNHHIIIIIIILQFI